MSDPIRVPVALGTQSYDVVIGAGVRRMLPDVVARLSPGRIAIVTARRPSMLPPLGAETKVIEVEEGEHWKTLSTVEDLCRAFARHGLHRGDLVVSCGGGSVSDTVGLAASLYHRGLAVVHLPTSLLAQVDASVGGKTAVNLPEGKNLVGAYWQPAAVLCDTDFLRSLPKRELLSGYGEIARCHFIGAGDLRRLPLEAQIAAGVRLKAAVVAKDERDTGPRHLLNYGHTLGHALEIASDFALRHGEAVAVGTVFAGELAGLLGRIPADRVAEHREVVSHYGLDCDLPSGVSPDRLLLLMGRDKKASGRGLSFVLDGPEGPELVIDVPPAKVRGALDSMIHPRRLEGVTRE
ncbi:3-dehydroquinate synthase family protein [Kribbella sp. NPDC051620]|uniref:3-dehydroquinate synthase family protein n=1 Tax=Kribbella sp. NPDC051620 TaxID=3364120 RepID=UPI0037B5FDB0